MVETPVLFITFVRPEYARQTFDAIKLAQPKKLYFYSNKGREEKEGEVERNQIIRSYINEIDWPCELHTWFRDECVNAYDSLRGAITWLFDNEETGIVLEEDCVPTLGFFSFVDQLIPKFRDIKDVWYISGDNFYDLNPSVTDYIFSRYHWLYGWASWRDRWQAIKWGDYNLEQLVVNKTPLNLYKTKRQGRLRLRQIRDFQEMLLRTGCWDFAFGCTVDANRGFGVFPKTHLVHNIGLAGEHHGIPVFTFVNVVPTFKDMSYTIQEEPQNIDVNLEFDYSYFKIRQKQKPLKERIYSMLVTYNLSLIINLIKFIKRIFRQLN